MKHSFLIQKACSPRHETINGMLEKHIRSEPYDRISIAMAYVSVAGVRALLSAFPKNQIKSSRWLVGLDDAVTQPGAIDLILRLDNAEVRVATLAKSAFRFHPKVCRFECTSKKNKNLLMIGSANLTKSALLGNSEAVVFLHCNSSSDRTILSSLWDELWSQGLPPDKEVLDEYRLQYEASKKSRRKAGSSSKKNISGVGKAKTTKKTSLVLDHDDAELDPSCATTCWIECGFITAMGRELEFKAEQGLFFGIEPSGGESKSFRFRTSNGSIVNLRMKYQENHMWRLQMNNNIPEVATGLRPILPDGKLGRSPYVAVFTRTEEDDLFNILFIKLESPRFAQLKKNSEQSGSIGFTSARCYGWC